MITAPIVILDDSENEHVPTPLAPMKLKLSMSTQDSPKLSERFFFYFFFVTIQS